MLGDFSALDFDSRDFYTGEIASPGDPTTDAHDGTGGHSGRRWDVRKAQIAQDELVRRQRADEEARRLIVERAFDPPKPTESQSGTDELSVSFSEADDEDDIETLLLLG